MEFVPDENEEVKKTEILKRISELSFIRKKHRRNRKSTASSVNAGNREGTVDKKTENISDTFTSSKCENSTHPQSSKIDEIHLRADKNTHRKQGPDEHRCHAGSKNTSRFEHRPGSVPKSDVKLSVARNRPLNDENGHTMLVEGNFFRKIPVTSDHYRKFCVPPSERLRLANEMKSRVSKTDTHCDDYRTSGVNNLSRKSDSKTRVLQNVSHCSDHQSGRDSPSPVISPSSAARLPQTGTDDNNNKPDFTTGPLAVENSNLNPNVAAFVPVYYSSSDYASVVANLGQSMSPGAMFIIPNNMIANAHQVSGQFIAVTANGNAPPAGHQLTTVISGSGNATTPSQPQPPGQPATATIQAPEKGKRRAKVGYVLNRKPKETTQRTASADCIMVNPKSSLDTDMVKTLNQLDAMRLNSMRRDVPTNELSDGGFTTGTLRAPKKMATSEILTDNNHAAPLVLASDQLSLIANQLEAGVQTASPLWFETTPSKMASARISTIEILNENNGDAKPLEPKPIVGEKISWPRVQPVTAYSEAGIVDSAYWMLRDSANRTEPQCAPFQPKIFDQSQIQFSGSDSMTINVTDDLFVAKEIENNLPPSKFVQQPPANAAAEPPYIQPQPIKSDFVLPPSINDMMKLVQESVGVKNLNYPPNTPPPPLPVHGVSSFSTIQPLVNEFGPPGRKRSHSMSTSCECPLVGQPVPSDEAPSPSITDASFAQQLRGGSKAPYQSEVSTGEPISVHAATFPPPSFARQFHNTEMPFQSERASNGKPSPMRMAAFPTPNLVQHFAGAKTPYQPSEYRLSNKPLSVNAATFQDPSPAQRFAVTEAPYQSEAPGSLQESMSARRFSCVETAAHQSAQSPGYASVPTSGRLPPGIPISHTRAQFETPRRLSAGDLKQPHRPRVGFVAPSGPQRHQPPPNDGCVRLGRVPPGFECQPLPERPATGILKYPPQILESDISFSHVQSDTHESRNYVNSCPKRVTFAPDDGSPS